MNSSSKFVIKVVAVLGLSVAITAAWATTGVFHVEWKGLLRDTHGGDISGKATLADLPRSPQLYAIGPAAGLAGEITIIDGRLFLAKVRSGSIDTSSDYQGQASFLVWATVPQWQDAVPIGQTVVNAVDLERLIETKARLAGLDTDKPFPFLLQGRFNSVKYHVVLPPSAQGMHGSSASPTDSQLDLRAGGKSGTVIGFFSKKHEGVFTHRGSYSHLHVSLEDGNSGHVDDLEVAADVSLLFPRT
jgi:acetolactate decarboxylase